MTCLGAPTSPRIRVGTVAFQALGGISMRLVWGTPHAAPDQDLKKPVERHEHAEN